MERRRLGQTDLMVSPVALGCWPMAGVTTLHTSETDSVQTLEACLDSGINFLDTAYCYGFDGESEKLIAKALKNRREEYVLATKGGIWLKSPSKEVVHEATPEAIKRQCDESRERLQTDHIDLYYLHSPDPNVPLEESAGAILELVRSGKVRYAGASNCTLEQYQTFHAVCPLTAIQPPYNMLQRGIEREMVPWCLEQDISICTYWPLMKGLLAGGLTRDHVFEPEDGRAKMPMFQGDEWEKNMIFVDRLREIASETGHTVAQLVVHWTTRQRGVTSALCGAKRPEQIRETAGAMGWEFTPAQHAAIEAALVARGEAVTQRNV